MIQFFIKHSKELTIAGALSVLTICYFQQRELTKLRIETQTQTQIIDSLNDENFNSRVEVGRYELTLDHLKEVNPKIGKEMEEWMSHETE
jgi:flagellar motor switch/type III secretory pathway protein FliN